MDTDITYSVASKTVMPKISGITNSPGLVVQRNQALQLTQSFQTGPDDIGKRL